MPLTSRLAVAIGGISLRTKQAFRPGVSLSKIPAYEGLPHQPTAQLFARASRFATDETCHCPPRAVRTPRSLSVLAIATPADWMLRTMGRRLAAKRSASSPLYLPTGSIAQSGAL